MKTRQTYQKPMIKMRDMVEESLLVTVSSGSQDNDQALSKGWGYEEDDDLEKDCIWN